MSDNDHDLGTILGVWAHPDDETYLSAGLMAMARREGRDVTCVTATCGEHGTPDPQEWPPDRLARVRHHEIAAAMAVLGVTDHRELGYEDGTLAAVDDQRAIGQISHVIDEVAPDTVLTFGPDGMTGHPDHVTISRWATNALREVRPQARLLYATKSASWLDAFGDLEFLQDLMVGGTLPRTPDEELAVDVELSPDVCDQKVAALRAQATQTAALIQTVGLGRYAAMFGREMFRAAQ